MIDKIKTKLGLLEMEGKFEVRRPKSSIQAATSELSQTDKFLDYTLAKIDKLEELQYLKHLSTFLFYLPFEINQRAQLNLQVSETFQLSYLDSGTSKDSYIRDRRDSGFENKTDSGIKLTILYVINGDQGKSSTLTLTSNSEISENDKAEVELLGNTLVLFNARAFSYSISGQKQR